MTQHTSPITLAIADDHPLFAQGMQLLLNSLPDFSVVAQASNGYELLKLLPAHPVDLVLLDLNMPVMDGLATCRELSLRYPHIKPVILSFSYEEEAAEQLQLAGAKGYLTKDIEPALLQQQLHTIVKGGSIFRSAKAKTPESSKEITLCQKISLREKQIASMIGKGLTSNEIAHNLYLSVHTVNQHRKNILSKLNLKNTLELVAFATRHTI